MVHWLSKDAGLYAIASIKKFSLDSDGRDPNRVIYGFGNLWGFEQTIFAALMWVVLLRYKSLIPLMLGINLFCWVYREVNSAMFPFITAEYYEYAPPGV